MFIAFIAAFILPDLPHNTRGFSEDELRVAQLRMIEDVGEADVDAEGDGVFTGLNMAIRDPKIWLMILASFLFVCGLTFNAFFVSEIRCSLRANDAADTDNVSAHAHPNTRVFVRPDAPHERSSLGVCRRRLDDQRMARRQDAREGTHYETLDAFQPTAVANMQHSFGTLPGHSSVAVSASLSA
jgi:hypothetical protein